MYIYIYTYIRYIYIYKRKFQKLLSKARFIIVAPQIFVKPVSTTVTTVLKLFDRQKNPE